MILFWSVIPGYRKEEYGHDSVLECHAGCREEERRQAKRARGILASSLPFTFFSYFGVTK